MTERQNAFTDNDGNADFMYGGGSEKLASIPKTLRARAIPIAEITPDPLNPRRSLPPYLRERWDGAPDTLPAILTRWLTDIQQHTRINPVSIGQIIRGEVALSDIFQDELRDTGKAIDDFAKSLSLAASIYENGLDNPLSIARNGTGFLLESGERRVIAHHMIVLWGGDEKSQQFNRALAFIYDEHDPFRQGIENNMRAPLSTGVERCQQVLRLIMEMYKREKGADFGDPPRNGSLQAYYQQVADGTAYRVLDGYASVIETATGMSDNAMRQYRRLIKMPPEMWDKALIEGWSGRRCRDEFSAYNRRNKGRKSVSPDTLLRNITSEGDTSTLSDEEKQTQDGQQREYREADGRASRDARTYLDGQKAEKDAATAEADAKRLLAEAKALREKLTLMVGKTYWADGREVTVVGLHPTAPDYLRIKDGVHHVDVQYERLSDTPPEKDPHPGTHMVGKRYWLTTYQVEVLDTQWDDYVVVRMPSGEDKAVPIRHLSATPPPPEQSPPSTLPGTDSDDTDPSKTPPHGS